VKYRSFDHISAPDINNMLPRFVGLIMQEPPVYSALKVRGVRAYDLARAGTPPKLEPRHVRVHSLELLDYTAPIARIRVVCHGGVYVRALARDIGGALGSCAMLSGLQRTRVGAFTLAHCLSLEGLSKSEILDAMAEIRRNPRHFSRDPIVSEQELQHKAATAAADF